MSFADKFNLFNEFNILRIICGAFFIPHIIGKITVPQALQFLSGFKHIITVETGEPIAFFSYPGKPSQRRRMAGGWSMCHRAPWW